MTTLSDFFHESIPDIHEPGLLRRLKKTFVHQHRLVKPLFYALSLPLLTFGAFLLAGLLVNTLRLPVPVLSGVTQAGYVMGVVSTLLGLAFFYLARRCGREQANHRALVRRHEEYRVIEASVTDFGPVRSEADSRSQGKSINPRQQVRWTAKIHGRSVEGETSFISTSLTFFLEIGDSIYLAVHRDNGTRNAFVGVAKSPQIVRALESLRSNPVELKRWYQEYAETSERWTMTESSETSFCLKSSSSDKQTIERR